MSRKRTVNITLKILDEHITRFENELKNMFDLVSFKILPETEKMYQENKEFRRKVDTIKKLQRERDEFINKHGGDYEI